MTFWNNRNWAAIVFEIKQQNFLNNEIMNRTVHLNWEFSSQIWSQNSPRPPPPQQVDNHTEIMCHWLYTTKWIFRLPLLGNKTPKWQQQFHTVWRNHGTIWSHICSQQFALTGAVANCAHKAAPFSQKHTPLPRRRRYLRQATFSEVSNSKIQRYMNRVIFMSTIRKDHMHV